MKLVCGTVSGLLWGLIWALEQVATEIDSMGWNR